MKDRTTPRAGGRTPSFDARFCLYCTAQEEAEGMAGIGVGLFPARGRLGPRRARVCAAGQALVEFALTAPLFVFLLFFCLTAGMVTLERSAVVNAATTGARIAAGSVAGGDLNQPALRESERKVAELLRPSLLGTAVAIEPPQVPCPRVESLGQATAVVCALAPTADTVRVEVVARPAGFLPAAAGGLWQQLDLYAVVHTATFKR